MLAVLKLELALALIPVLVLVLARILVLPFARTRTFRISPKLTFPSPSKPCGACHLSLPSPRLDHAYAATVALAKMMTTAHNETREEDTCQRKTKPRPPRPKVRQVISACWPYHYEACCERATAFPDPCNPTEIPYDPLQFDLPAKEREAGFERTLTNCSYALSLCSYSPQPCGEWPLLESEAAGAGRGFTHAFLLCVPCRAPLCRSQLWMPTHEHFSRLCMQGHRDVLNRFPRRPAGRHAR